jgi:hypothetical protein
VESKRALLAEWFDLADFVAVRLTMLIVFLFGAAHLIRNAWQAFIN